MFVFILSFVADTQGMLQGEQIGKSRAVEANNLGSVLSLTVDNIQEDPLLATVYNLLETVRQLLESIFESNFCNYRIYNIIYEYVSLTPLKHKNVVDI